MLIFLSIIWHNENKLREARPTPSEITLATGETIEDPIAPPPAICDLPSDPKHPYRLTVPKAEVVNACVRNVGTSEIKNADGTTSYQIQTAKNIHQVGWYNKRVQ